MTMRVSTSSPFYSKRSMQRASSTPSSASSSSSHYLFPINESIPHTRSMSILPRHSTTDILPCWPPKNPVLATTSTTTTTAASSKEGTKMKHKHVKDHRLWWSWKHSNNVTLTTLPPFYVLERSSMVVQQPLQQVLERIDNFLRLKSIVSVLHPAEAARLDCRISGMASFAIYLWKAEPARDNDDVGSIIIEVQRRTGCCIFMHHIQKSLFHYIMTGKEPDATAYNGTTTSPSPMTMPRTFDGDSMVHRVICSSIRKQQQLEVSEEELCKDAKDNMEICEDLLKSNLEDHKRMGMESLYLMTNPFVSCEKLARAIAQALIYGNVEHDMILLPSSVNVLRNELMKHLEHNGQPTAMQVKVRESIVDNDDIEELEYEQGHDFGVLHNLALHILVNALEVVSSENQDKNTKKVGTMNNIDLTSDFWYTVTEALVYNLSVAVHRPDEASLSARCLSLLQDIAPPISSHNDLLTMLRMHDQSLSKKLFRAQDYGRAHHLRLEEESRHLLRRLTTP